MKKALSLALALALCMGLFSGCGTETGSNSTSQPAQSSGETVKTVTWASTSDITGLDPRNGNSTITASILASLYSTLVKTDPQGQIVCDAAESYEQVDDTTWHFTLRQDVYFTNGTQMTADDVAYTINSLRDSEKHYALSGDFSFMQVEVLGDFEFNIITDYAFPSLPLRLNYIKIVPSAYVEEVGDEGFAAAPIGSGPFKFVSWDTAGGMIVLERNTDYYGKVPSIERIVYKTVAVESTKALMLRSGEADLAWLNAKYARTFRGKDGFTTVDFTTADLRTVAMDFHTPFWQRNKDSIAVLNYAVDKQAIVDGVLAGQGFPAFSPIQTSPLGGNPAADVYPYDLKKFAAEMERLGWKKGPDGIYARNGERFSFIRCATTKKSAWTSSTSCPASSRKPGWK